MSNTHKKELRFAELRRAKESRSLHGFAARFNERSLDLGGFVEQILPGAFTECLASGQEVRALVDHDPTKILAKRSNGGLRISENSQGLAVEFDVPKTSYGDDLLACVDADLIAGMSFGFYCLEDRWESLQENGQTINLRSVVTALVFEITCTSVPAYPTTSLASRSFPDGVPASIEQRMAASAQMNETAIRRQKCEVLLAEIQAENEAADNSRIQARYKNLFD